MNLSRAYLLAATTALVHTTALANVWYPDWQGGTNACLNDGDEPLYMTKGSYTETTQELCCKRYYLWNLNACMGTTGAVIVGTAKWYVDYEGGKCQQDCADASTPAGCTRFGGLAAGSDTLYEDETKCCEGKLGYMALALCEANSLGNAYTGSGKFYVDYQNNRCVADAAADTLTDIAGGIIEDASTTLYDTVVACCAGKLSYINKDVCAANSDLSSTGTGKYFADPENFMCVKDSDATCPAGETCERATPNSGALFDTAALCCAGTMSWVDDAYCEMLSTGVATEKWFLADMQDGGCVKDCSAAELTSNSGGPEDYCGTLDNNNVKLYDDEVDCCAGQLGWVDKDRCATVSLGGVLTGSNLWYVDYEGKQCVQDCTDAAEAGCDNPGGLADGSETLYADAEKCCEGKLGYLNAGLCEYTSSAVAIAYTGSLDYYVDYENNRCVQDCADDTATDCVTPGGFVEDTSTMLYADAALCCAAKLGYMNKDLCESNSDATSTGTGKFYADTQNGKCIVDIDATDSLCAAGGPAELYECKRATPTSGALYNDPTACCKGGLAYVDEDLCVALTTGEPSEKWFMADQQDGGCVKDCSAAELTSNSGGPEDYCAVPDNLNIKMYESAATCCSTQLGWIKKETCEAYSTTGVVAGPVAPTDTTDYWVDWSLNKCVMGCDASAAGAHGDCGGFPESWDTTYTSRSACCARLSWVEDDKCTPS